MIRSLPRTSRRQSPSPRPKGSAEWILAFLLVLSAVFVSRVARAHIPVYGVGTVTEIRVESNRLVVIFDLSYNGFWAQGEMITMDVNKDTEVQTSEAETYMKGRWEKKTLEGTNE